LEEHRGPQLRQQAPRAAHVLRADRPPARGRHAVGDGLWRGLPRGLGPAGLGHLRARQVRAEARAEVSGRADGPQAGGYQEDHHWALASRPCRQV
ncbi:hypothetical protein LTR16_010991, partial [Cryomyces antarcticus]